MRLWLIVLCAVAGAGFGLFGEWAFSHTGAGFADMARDLAVGWVYVGVGLVTWWRRPENQIGKLMVAEGLSWFFGNLQGLDAPLLVALGAWLEGLNLAILGHLVLALPDGRLGTRSRKLVVLAGYGVVAVVGLARTMAYDPAAHPEATYLDCSSCTHNLLLLPGVTSIFPVLDTAYKVSGGALALIVAGMAVHRWITTPRPNRHGAVTIWSLLSLLVAFAVLAWQVPPAGPSAEPSGPITWLADLTQVVVPLSFLFIPFRRQLATAAVADLVIEAGRSALPTRLRDALARALRDPGLELGFWMPEQNSYVDSEGRPLVLPDRDAPRTATYLEQAGAPLAVLVHDRALLHERSLMNGALAAARLGLENERLQAQVRAQLEELRSTSIRVVQAGDAARRRLERDLHDGAQQRLVSVLMHLHAVREQAGQAGSAALDAELERATVDLRMAVSELRELANGIHPALLTQGGLASAVTALAQVAPLVVEVSIPGERYPPLVEATAYFIVSEALANAAKHSGGTKAQVTVRRRDEQLLVEVVDDGVGGASAAGGSGLTGLQDRAAVLRGEVVIDSPRGLGTRIQARLPCA